MNTVVQDLDKQPVAEPGSIDEQVPIIDIAHLLQDSTDSEACTAVDDIAKACQYWGFFQVINHRIAGDLIEDVWHQMQTMFALPDEEKHSVLRSKDNPWSFYPNELTKNQRDKKEVFDFTREGMNTIYGKSNRWLANQQDFKSTMLSYFDTCTSLSLSLLQAFCLGLNLPANYMRDNFTTNHTGLMRLNYYPTEGPMANSDITHQPVADPGIHHQTDAGALTVLLQDNVGGLQVYKEGYWHNIPPVPGAIVINTGDMMQVWSNDIYNTPIHRVLAMETRNRYSLPFFFNPSATSKVAPLLTVVSDQRPARYHPIEWADFRGKRSEGDYGD